MFGKNEYLDKLAGLRKRFRKTPTWQKRLIVFGGFFIFSLLIISLDFSPSGTLLEVGEKARRTILSPSTLQYVDEARTRQLRKAAEDAVPPCYSTREKASEHAQESLKDFFEITDEVDRRESDRTKKEEEIFKRISGKVTKDEIGELISVGAEKRREIQDVALKALANVMAGEVKSDMLWDARNLARHAAMVLSSDLEIQRISGELAACYIEANMVFDKKETENRKKAARESVKPVVITLTQGEPIINKGEVATKEKVELLKTLGFRKATFTVRNILSTTVFLLALIFGSAVFLRMFRKSIYDSPGMLLCLGGLVITFSIVCKVLVIASRNWSIALGYLIPTAAVAFVTAVLTDWGCALLIVIACSLITGIISRGDFSMVAFALLGGIMPALLVSKQSGRHELRRVGLYCALWLAFIAFAMGALSQARENVLINTGMGFLNGVISSIIAMGSLPFLETSLRVTTNTRLLELASPDQPLLKELSMKAPGTYSHSVMVANLAEAAARVVGSDPLIARVAAYYHDVGKMKRPQFFVENQPQNLNPHVDISPNLSSLIITSHVKDGVEMLEKNHLPPDLIEAIREHHGTSVVKYFYDKALESDEKASVEESRFRYRFEKPKTKTAAILLLADSVEATARTLRKPSAQAIGEMVDRIVEGKVADGQLDDSDLTLADLRKIKEAFSKILISAYHPRVDYVGTKLDEGKKSAERKNNLGGNSSKKGEEKT